MTNQVSLTQPRTSMQPDPSLVPPKRAQEMGTSSGAAPGNKSFCEHSLPARTAWHFSANNSGTRQTFSTEFDMGNSALSDRIFLSVLIKLCNCLPDGYTGHPINVLTARKARG